MNLILGSRPRRLIDRITLVFLALRFIRYHLSCCQLCQRLPERGVTGDSPRLDVRRRVVLVHLPSVIADQFVNVPRQPDDGLVVGIATDVGLPPVHGDVVVTGTPPRHHQLQPHLGLGVEPVRLVDASRLGVDLDDHHVQAVAHPTVMDEVALIPGQVVGRPPIERWVIVQEPERGVEVIVIGLVLPGDPLPALMPMFLHLRPRKDVVVASRRQGKHRHVDLLAFHCSPLILLTVLTRTLLTTLSACVSLKPAFTSAVYISWAATAPSSTALIGSGMSFISHLPGCCWSCLSR